MKHTLSWICGLGLTATAVPQNESVLPEACADLPGNAAVSMPVRWSEGIMQVIVHRDLLPTNFVGTVISGLRMRRPSFLGEPAYPAVQRTMTVRGGFAWRQPQNLTTDLLINRPANVPVLFGPAPAAVAATSAQGAATGLGEDMLSITFTTPLTVAPGHLFLEFETTDGPLVVLPDNWVDAVWLEDGVENGYAVTVGDGSCTTRAIPTELVWTDPSIGPVSGGTAPIGLRGAIRPPPLGSGTLAFVWLGINPQPRAATSTFVGYGVDLAALDPGLAGCHQWVPMDAVVSGTVSVTGSYDFSFSLPDTPASTGMRIGVQAAWLDTSRPGLPLSVSNGLMMVLDEIEVGSGCATQFFPGTATTAPWERMLGLMPILVLEHN